MSIPLSPREGVIRIARGLTVVRMSASTYSSTVSPGNRSQLIAFIDFKPTMTWRYGMVGSEPEWSARFRCPNPEEHHSGEAKCLYTDCKHTSPKVAKLNQR